MGPRHRQNGTQRRERHLGRSWWSLEWHVASSGRALLPAVRHPTKNNKSRNAKHIHSSSLVALRMRVFKGLRICKVACVVRNESYGVKAKA